MGGPDRAAREKPQEVVSIRVSFGYPRRIRGVLFPVNSFFVTLLITTRRRRVS
jgi:hypothetical protein